MTLTWKPYSEAPKDRPVLFRFNDLRTKNKHRDRIHFDVAAWSIYDKFFTTADALQMSDDNSLSLTHLAIPSTAEWIELDSFVPEGKLLGFYNND
jgi:hypothetical protein